MNNNADVKAVAQLVSYAGIISSKQLDAFLFKRGLNKKRSEAVKKILTSNQYVYADSSKTYYSASPMTNYAKFTENIKKAVWLFIDSMPTMDYVNFKCKMPCIAYICNAQYESLSDVEDYTVFYIPKGQEDISTRIINTNFGGETSTVNTIIIIDNVSQIEKIKLENPLKIVSFATIDNDGNVSYF